MSASLVGSEMCIRDRPTWPTWPRSMVDHADSVAEPRFRHCPACPCRCASVSYTHLTLPTICSV
eukprot:7533631-Alexandrium_andersonii.AAC.1